MAPLRISSPHVPSAASAVVTYVSVRSRLRVFVSVSMGMLMCMSASAVDQPKDLDRQFQSAVAEYNSGKFPEAAAQLESLLREVPESFEVHELLGMVYSAQSRDAKARE